MLGLIPRDYWDHRLSDALQGIIAALKNEKEEETLHISEIGECLPIRSGRAGLVAAIDALKLPHGAKVGVPLFCCPVVFESIAEASCEPCFIDIDPETFCIKLEDLYEKLPQIEAIVAVHMFGNMCDIGKLKAIAQSRPVIEDCAQSLGSSIDGKHAGSIGDVAFFSFRSGKYLSAGEGGAVYAKQADVRLRLAQLISRMRRPTITDEFAHMAKIYIKSVLRSRPLYGIAGFNLWKIWNQKPKFTQKSGAILGQIYRSDFAIAKKRLAFLNFAVERQRAYADFYSGTLKLAPGMLCREVPGAFYNRYHYPITFSSSIARDFMSVYLLKKKIDSMRYLDDVVELAQAHYGYNGNCPIAERLSKTVLIIPSYYSLSKSDVGRIACCVNAGWAELTSRGRGFIS